MKTETNNIVAYLLNVDALDAENCGEIERAESMRGLAKHCKDGIEGALGMARGARTEWAQLRAA